MAVYFVTGKLGAGKTLAAVGRIKDYLLKGAPVATNLDLRLDKLLTPYKKNTQVYRLPDKPSIEDFEQLGKGNESYDEKKNGLIVLDECGTWFNSRSWNDKSRQQLIDWFLHARKLGWDIIFIIQNVQIVDKQARLALCEYMVVCRRADRFLKIPLVEPLFKAIFGYQLPKPQFHLGIVKYGDSNDSITVDRWWYRGSDLYDAYDTKQAFTSNYPYSLYQLLPPYFSHGRYKVKQDWSYFMRMTKIYFKRFNRPALAIAGVVLGFFMASALTVTASPEPEESTLIDLPGQLPIDQANEQIVTLEEIEEPETEPEHGLEGFYISGSASNSQGILLYMTVSNGQETYSLQELKGMGYQTRVIDKCRLRVISNGIMKVLHTNSCSVQPIESESRLKQIIAKAPKYADTGRDYSRSE